MLWQPYGHIMAILIPVFLHQIAAVSSDIEEIEKEVERYQRGVEDIQPDDDVVAVQRLVDDAEDIAQND